MLTITGLATQNSPFSGKANVSNLKGVLSSSKRPFEPSTFDEFDGENIDPATLCSPSKKSKNDAPEKAYKPFTFSLSPSKSMPPPPTIPSHLTTPAKVNMPSPRAPLTAPAGRSPKRKSSGVYKNRRVSAPFSRIDPPLSSRNDSVLPFSLDAALSGTFSKPSPRDVGATIQESMPKNWFFDIYEDSPEEEAANLMEHSTLTLDLSSDEESSKSMKDDKGKENQPPEDYDAPTASRVITGHTIAAPKRVKKGDILRRKVETDKMDDGERSPLSDLETDDFIPEGLDKDAHIIANPTPEKSSSVSSKLDIHNLFAVPVPFSGSGKKTTVSTPSKNLHDMPVVTADGDVAGDIIIWEDSPSTSSVSVSVEPHSDEDKIKDACFDENCQPSAD